MTKQTNQSFVLELILPRVDPNKSKKGDKNGRLKNNFRRLKVTETERLYFVSLKQPIGMALWISKEQ